MSQLNTMKQIGAKNVGFKVTFMEWSSKMDLLAIGNDKGEIIIQRINWQKVCIFPPPEEHVEIRGLAWRPDEAIISAGYSNGQISILDIEKEKEIYSYFYESEINTLNWTSNCNAINNIPHLYSSTKIKEEDYLVTLPNLNSFASSKLSKEPGSDKNFSKNSPNFLVVSLISGDICLSVFGILQCGIINVFEHAKYPKTCKIIDARLSSTFEQIYTFIKDGEELTLLVLQNDLLSKNIDSILRLAVKYVDILETLNYINHTIQCIIEAWETVLLEMDNKLTKYANSQPEGSISADFLELLMFGYPSEALDQFLTRDLTEKGLKKLGNSIELSYSTIQNLVVKPLNSAAIQLFYHLNILKGFSNNSYYYKALITEEGTNSVIASAGSFLIKIMELQQIIDQSVTDYKLFWYWLNSAIVRLMDESVQDDIASVTQEDITYLAEFLNKFDNCIIEKEDGSIVKRKFNLERVGQYLEDNDLQFPPKFDSNHQWNNLIEENECFRELNILFPHNKNYSLIQQHNLLKTQINNLFTKPNKIIGESFELQTKIKIATLTLERPLCTNFIFDETSMTDMLIVTIDNTCMMYIESNPKTNELKISKLVLNNEKFGDIKARRYNKLNILNTQFYNNQILSMLLEGFNNGVKSFNYFLQLPLFVLRESCTNICRATENTDTYSRNIELDIFNFIDINNLKPIEGLVCSFIAVSGSRKIASVLSDDFRKIRIYEMEVEDEDEDAEMTQNSILDNSKESAE